HHLVLTITPQPRPHHHHPVLNTTELHLSGEKSNERENSEKVRPRERSGREI
ncbi:hypothetical protein A2U01_0097014, partial [Trifolium medium]|nr:hypothetical protein [Trifolium medium]